MLIINLFRIPYLAVRNFPARPRPCRGMVTVLVVELATALPTRSVEFRVDDRPSVSSRALTTSDCVFHSSQAFPSGVTSASVKTTTVRRILLGFDTLAVKTGGTRPVDGRSCGGILEASGGRAVTKKTVSGPSSSVGSTLDGIVTVTSNRKELSCPAKPGLGTENESTVVV